MIDLERIKELVKMMVDNDLVEVSLRDGSEEVSVKRPGHNAPPPPPSGPAAVPVVSTSEAAAHALGQAPPDDSSAPAQDDGLVPIHSPMVGTYYHASSPESPPYVQTGSAVSADTVVCIVEAMKVFNEIKAEVSGTIERVLVADQDPVEYGQDLFLVRPPS